MFNLFPGQGLGFSASRLTGLGLAPVSVYEVTGPELPQEVPLDLSGAGGPGGSGRQKFTIYDNAYSFKPDDEEIIQILMVFFEVVQ